MINENWKNEYRNLDWTNGWLYHKPFWLDAVAGDSWGVARFPAEGQAKAYMPYAFQKDRDGICIIMPPFTAFMGPMFIQQPAKDSDVYKIIEGLYEQLPSYGLLRHRWPPTIDNWLPAYWMGLQGQTYYTYVIEDLKDHEEIWNNMQGKVRTAIRKAEKLLTVKEEPDDVLIENLSWMPHVNYDANTLKGILAHCGEQGCKKVLGSRDESGELTNLILVVWDNSRMYYLVGIRNPEKSNEGGSQLIYEAMKHAPEGVDVFDFEGSMIKGIESYFRSFGAVRQPYFEISSYASRYRKLRQALHFLKAAISG